MPSYTRGKKRENLVYVAVNAVMLYGWKRKDLASIAGVSETDLTNIGHVKAEGSTPSGKIIIIGARAPQPPRVTKRIQNATVGQQQTVSTFCAFDKLATALGGGWSLAQSKKGVSLRAPNASNGSITAIATLSDGSMYCFPMNKADFEAYGSQLGLDSAGSETSSNLERDKLVAGSTRPKPGKANRRLEDGSTFGSFFTTSKADAILQAGFAIISEEVVIKTAPAGGGT